MSEIQKQLENITTKDLEKELYRRTVCFREEGKKQGRPMCRTLCGRGSHTYLCDKYAVYGTDYCEEHSISDCM